MKNSSWPGGVHTQSRRAGCSEALVRVRRVGRDVEGLALKHDRFLAAEGRLDLALEHVEHLLEIVAVPRGAAALGEVHASVRV